MSPRDPLLTEPYALPLPEEWGHPLSTERRKQYLLARTEEELRKDVTEAHDRVRRLVRANDQLRRALLAAQSQIDKLKWTRIWVKVLTMIVGAEGVAIGWLVRAFLDHHVK